MGRGAVFWQAADVVQQCGGEGLLVLPELGEDLCGAPGMADESLAGAALLTLVRIRSEAKGPREQFTVDGWVVRLHVRKQLVEQLPVQRGDTVLDVRAGHAAHAGVVVGVLTGGQTESELAAEHPTHILDGVHLVPGLLSRSIPA